MLFTVLFCFFLSASGGKPGSRTAKKVERKTCAVLYRRHEGCKLVFFWWTI